MRYCDTLIQKINRLSHKYCVGRGKSCTKVNEVGHHFIPKSCSAWLRYEMKNIVPLCGKCHARVHCSEDPQIEMNIINTYGMAWYQDLETQRAVGNKESSFLTKAYYLNVKNNLERMYVDIGGELEGEI